MNGPGKTGPEAGKTLWTYNSYSSPDTGGAGKPPKSTPKGRGVPPQKGHELWTYNSYQFPAQAETNVAPQPQPNPTPRATPPRIAESVLEYLEDQVAGPFEPSPPPEWREPIYDSPSREVRQTKVQKQPARNYWSAGQIVLFVVLGLGLAAALLVASFAYKDAHDLEGFSVCNAGQNLGLDLPGCPTTGPSVAGLGLVFGNNAFSDLAFVKRLEGGVGINVTAEGGTRVGFAADIQSLTPRLIVGVAPAPGKAITLDLNATGAIACNAGNNSGQELPSCPQSGQNSGEPLLFGNSSLDNFVFARRVRSLSSSIIVSIGGANEEFLDLNLNLTNVTGTVLCSTGDNTGLDLPRCPAVGNTSGVPLVFGNSTEPEIVQIKRLASNSPAIVISTAGFDADLVLIDFNETGLDVCNVSCSQNFVLNIENSPSGFGIQQGFNHTFTGLVPGSAILSGESSTLNGAALSVVLGGSFQLIDGGTGNGVYSGRGHTINGACVQSFISGGDGHTMTDSDFSGILQGQGSVMDNADYCIIVNGDGHTITDANYVTILSGANHVVGAGADRSSILSGNGLSIAGANDADTAHAANLHSFGSLRASGLRTVAGGSTVTVQLGDFLFVIEGGAGTATVQMPPGLPSGMQIMFRIVGSTDLNIQAISGARLCPLTSGCTVNGLESVTADNEARFYINTFINDRWYSFT